MCKEHKVKLLIDTHVKLYTYHIHQNIDGYIMLM